MIASETFFVTSPSSSASTETETETSSVRSLSLVRFPPSPLFVGVVLALLSSVFIGTSFILKKKGLQKQQSSFGHLRAAQGGFGYLREFYWWIGLLTMGLGEFCNFTAYGFAPASVVTPLGALSVLVSSLLAVRYLEEKLNILGKIGCLLTVLGSVVIVIHAPSDNDIHSLNDFALRILSPEFVVYSLLLLVTLLVLLVYYVPRWASSHVHVNLLVCSLFGAFTVTSCQGLAVGLKEVWRADRTYSSALTFACALVLSLSVIVQMIFLNRSLDVFSTSIVTTVYYVLFTAFVLLTSGVLFHEWRRLTFVDIVACLIGFLTSTIGLVLIHFLRDASTLASPSSSPHSFGNDTSLSSYFTRPNDEKPTTDKCGETFLGTEMDLSSSSLNSFNEQRSTLFSFDDDEQL